jgi:putative SOS response-associated peptidase YedK
MAFAVSRTDHRIIGSLDTDPNGLVKPIHDKATPVILTKQVEIETWLTAPWDEAGHLQRPFADEMLRMVEPPPAIAA